MRRARAQLIGKLRAGLSIALVSDAGTPLVSDPGYRLVNLAIEEGIRVEPVPGASAVLAALAASGMPSDQFHFAGFLPPKAAQRHKVLERLKDQEATLVLYEAPHRILETLEDVEAVMGPRPAVVAREITKLHEEFLRGTRPSCGDTLQAPAVDQRRDHAADRQGAPRADATPIPEAVEEACAPG